MDICDLEYLLVVEWYGSIGKVVDVLGLLQFVLIKVVQWLEVQVGVMLFECIVNGMMLMLVGVCFVVCVQWIVFEFDDVMQEMCVICGGEQGVVWVGYLLIVFNVFVFGVCW